MDMHDPEQFEKLSRNANTVFQERRLCVGLSAASFLASVIQGIGAIFFLLPKSSRVPLLFSLDGKPIFSMGRYSIFLYSFCSLGWCTALPYVVEKRRPRFLAAMSVITLGTQFWATRIARENSTRLPVAGMIIGVASLLWTALTSTFTKDEEEGARLLRLASVFEQVGDSCE